jgi:uncharacterized protein YigE (DUF2233 family)
MTMTEIVPDKNLTTANDENGNKKSRLVFPLIIVSLLAATLTISFFCFILPEGSKAEAVAAEKTETAAPSGSLAPTKAVVTPKPSPSLSPTPAPTPDPNDKYFTKSGEVVEVNDKKTEWTYMSTDLYIHITRYDIKKRKLHYFVSDIRTRGEQKFTSGFSYPKHPGRNALLPKAIARKLHAVYLQNGDYFEDKRNPVGIIIRRGKIYKNKKQADTLAIMPDGTLRVFSRGETSAKKLLKMGVKDTFSFGPTLIRDGKITPRLNKMRLSIANPRSGIGMIEKGHYIGIVVEGRNPKSCRGVTFREFAQMFADLGCTVAYNLDGGVSSAMVFMGKNLNLPTNILKTKTYRRIPDVIMIGTSDEVPKK